MWIILIKLIIRVRVDIVNYKEFLVGATKFTSEIKKEKLINAFKCIDNVRNFFFIS
jgi:hypothetical protein